MRMIALWIVLVAAPVVAGAGSPLEGLLGQAGALARALEERERAEVGREYGPCNIELSGPELIADGVEGIFRVHYTLEGGDAVNPKDRCPADGIPDYVNLILEALEENAHILYDVLGWEPPELAEGERFHLYVLDIESFGQADACILIDNRIPSLPIIVKDVFQKANVGHEMMHVSQYRYLPYQGVDPRWWLESVATWYQVTAWREFEEMPLEAAVIIGPRLFNCHVSLTSLFERYEYNCLWPLSLELSMGEGFLRRVFENWRSCPGADPLWIIDYVLKLSVPESDLETEFQKYTERNYTGWYLPTTDFVRRIVRVDVQASHICRPAGWQEPRCKLPEPLGANYIEFFPGNYPADGIVFRGEGVEEQSWGISLLGMDCAGDYHEILRKRYDAGEDHLIPVPDWSRYEKIVMVVQNLAWEGEARGYAYGLYTFPQPPTVSSDVPLVDTRGEEAGPRGVMADPLKPPPPAIGQRGIVGARR